MDLNKIQNLMSQIDVSLLVFFHSFQEILNFEKYKVKFMLINKFNYRITLT